MTATTIPTMPPMPSGDEGEEEEEDAGAGVGCPVSPFTVGWRVGTAVGDDDAVHLLAVASQTPDAHCESASACVIAVPAGFVEQYPPACTRDDPVPLPTQVLSEELEHFPLLHRELSLPDGRSSESI